LPPLHVGGQHQTHRARLLPRPPASTDIPKLKGLRVSSSAVCFGLLAQTNFIMSNFKQGPDMFCVLFGVTRTDSAVRRRVTRTGSAVERRGNPDWFSGISNTKQEFFTNTSKAKAKTWR
jgi:hypothetical protein